MNEKNNSSKFAEIMIMGIFLLIVFAIIFLIAGVSSARHKNGYIQGDYSEYKCSICKNAADGGAYFFDGKPYEDMYLCKEHFKEMRSNNSSDNIECKVCHREFKKGSENAKSIKKTNMCSHCYKNFKDASDVINELPQN